MGEFGKQLGSAGLGMLQGAVSGMLGMGLGKKNAENQLQNQMKLNKQMQDIQLENWEKTNYKAQVEQMEKAGLNVGMMYGGQGQGGQIGGASGGSAAMAPTPDIMGIALQAQQVAAQTELARAQAAKLRAETPTTGNLGDTNISKINQEIANLNSTKIGQDIQNALNNENFDTLVNMANTNLENAKKDGTIKNIEIGNLDAEYKANIANKIAETALKKAQESLTNQQEKESVAKIQQGWKDLQLKNKGLDIQQQQANIQAFGQETQRNNPSLMNAAGGVMNRGLKAIYRLFGVDMENSDTKVK